MDSMNREATKHFVKFRSLFLKAEERSLTIYDRDTTLIVPPIRISVDIVSVSHPFVDGITVHFFRAPVSIHSHASNLPYTLGHSLSTLSRPSRRIAPGVDLSRKPARSPR
jgi:hypothetical protein